MKIITFILSLLALSLLPPSVAFSQSNLILPSKPEDIRELVSSLENSPCEACGEVTDIRTKRVEGKGRLEQKTLSTPDLVATPVVGKGNFERGSQKRRDQSTLYLITVRYDNGQYASFEQSQKPTVTKNDKVKVVNGIVNLR